MPSLCARREAPRPWYCHRPLITHASKSLPLRASHGLSAREYEYLPTPGPSGWTFNGNSSSHASPGESRQTATSTWCPLRTTELPICLTHSTVPPLRGSSESMICRILSAFAIELSTSRKVLDAIEQHETLDVRQFRIRPWPLRNRRGIVARLQDRCFRAF